MGAKKLKSKSSKNSKGGYATRECGRSGDCSWVAHNTTNGNTTYGPVRNSRGQIVGSGNIFTISGGSRSNGSSNSSGSGANRSRAGKGTSA